MLVVPTTLRLVTACVAIPQFVQQFAFMVRNRTGGQLDTWLEAVAQSTLKDLHPFVKSIRLDIEAVEAGLILPWSNDYVA